MPLLKTLLQTEIKTLLQKMVEETDAQQAFDSFAQGLATAIDNYIKSADVSTTVTGTCATSVGPGTIAGTGTGKLQ